MSDIQHITQTSGLEYESSTKTITIKTSTWKRLRKYGNYYGSTFDSIIIDLVFRIFNSEIWELRAADQDEMLKEREEFKKKISKDKDKKQVS